MVASIEIIIQGQSHENRFAFLPGAWYNKTVIPQTLHQQQRERDEPELESAKPIPQEK